MDKNYQEKLTEHLEARPYRPETILTVNRITHVGRVSAEAALEIIEALEEDRLATDSEMRGLEADWGGLRYGYDQYQRVFDGLEDV